MTGVLPSSFDSIWIKLQRAEDHLWALKASLMAVVEGNLDTGIRVQTYADNRWEATFDLPDVDGDDPTWSLLVGEILYQLRSSLDHIINAIVPTQTKKTSFPIREDESSFDNDTSGSLEGIAVGSMDWAVTKELQPFRIDPEAPRDTTIWAINELARLDRHGFLRTSGVWLTEYTSVGFDPPGSGTVEYSMSFPGRIEHGTVIASGRLLRTIDQPEAEVRVFGAPELLLENIDGYRAGDADTIGMWAEREMTTALAFLAQVVRAYTDPAAFLTAAGQSW